MSEPPRKIRIVSTDCITPQVDRSHVEQCQMPGAQSDLSAATYQIHDETHTLGNSLRWMLMKK
jgi:hypothetical protein